MHKKVVLIYGLPASRTSLISAAFHRIGFWLGSFWQLDRTDERHPLGYFEWFPFVRLNDRIMADMFGHNDVKQAWTLPKPIQSCMGNKRKRKGWERWVSEFLEQLPLGCIGLKDPRLCYTIPIVRKVFEERGWDVVTVGCIRDKTDHIHKLLTIVPLHILDSGMDAVRWCDQFYSCYSRAYLSHMPNLQVSHSKLDNPTYLGNMVRNVCEKLGMCYNTSINLSEVIVK